MENTTEESNTQDNYLDTQVGENEGSKALEPKPIVIAGVSVKTKNKEEQIMSSPLIEICCKHPDKEEIIKLTKIKQLVGEKVIVTSLFVNVDTEGKFMKDSGIAALLKFHGVETLKELEGKHNDTLKESDNSKYLALKCY